jgi:uncharacterized phiE125 gp8 family phage protein
MHVYLYRPVLWRGGGVLRVIHSATHLTIPEIAALIRLKYATVLPLFHPFPGELMSNDRSSAVRLLTAPTSEPVTLTQAKAFLRIEHSADDVAITSAIASARYAAETYLRAALLPQTWEYTLANPLESEVSLPFGPATTISSITLTNEAGTTTTMAAANYRLSVDGFRVLFVNAPLIEKLKITYAASSFASVSVVPAPISQGTLHHVAVITESRDGSAPIPVQSLNLYQPFRRVML